MSDKIKHRQERKPKRRNAPNEGKPSREIGKRNNPIDNEDDWDIQEYDRNDEFS